MNGYSSHTFMWINAGGKRVWVKYHFKTEQGIQNFTAAEARAMRAEDPDYHRRDLRQAIGKTDYPAWRLEMQIMPFEDAATYRFNPFDLTKVWPHRDYPPITIGRLVLDRNPENFFAGVGGRRIRIGAGLRANLPLGEHQVYPPAAPVHLADVGRRNEHPAVVEPMPVSTTR
jgi:catalase